MLDLSDDRHRIQIRYLQSEVSRVEGLKDKNLLNSLDVIMDVVN